MSDRLTKQDLGRNELGEIVAHGIEYAEHHARQLAFGLAGALLAAILGLGVYLWAGHRSSQVNDELARALRVYTAEMVQAQKGEVVGFGFVIELLGLAGRGFLAPHPVESLIKY